MIFCIIFFFFFISGLMTGNIETVFISIPTGIWIGAIMQIAWHEAKVKVNNIEKVHKMRIEKEKQDQYDNYWGIIEYDDK